MSIRWTITLVTLGLVGAGVGGAGVREPVAPAPPVLVVPARPASIVVMGLLQAEASLDLRNQVAGLVSSIPHREGDSVGGGEPIVLLDATDSQLHVDLAQVDLDAAEVGMKKVRQGARDEERRRHKALYEEALAGLELAEKTLKSDQELHGKAMISDLELTKSERLLAAARAKSESKKLDLEILEKGATPEDRLLVELELQRRKVMLDQRKNVLAKCRISGSRKGRAHVSRILVDAGQWLDAGTTVAEIVYMERVKVDADLPASEALSLESGTVAKITSEAFPGVVLDGRVERVSPVIDPASGSVRVIIMADNPELAMRPGAEVTVEIQR
ncbi:MAG: HlyD family secretion protein [Planctomycetota bacterium]|jgi:multidrug efflux pump subunit AcrA (membrane-fusion protein)